MEQCFLSSADVECRRTASSSDIDLFLYGLTEEAALKKIVEIENCVRKSQRLEKGAGLTLRTENAITFVSPKWPYRHVQVRLIDLSETGEGLKLMGSRSSFDCTSL